MASYVQWTEAITSLQVGFTAREATFLLPAVALGMAAAVFAVRSRRFTAPGVILSLTLVLAARGLIFAALYDPATNWLHGDDYVRAGMAAEYAHGPQAQPPHPGCAWCDREGKAWTLEHRGPIKYPGDLSWLPLQFWVYGWAWPFVESHPHLGLTALSQLLMAAGTLVLFDLVRVVFSARVGVLSAVLWTFASWQVTLSFSCLGEPLAFLVSFAAVDLLFRWLSDPRRWQLPAMAVVFTLLTLTRYEGWILLGLLCLPAGWHMLRRPRAWKAAPAFMLPWIVPLLWCLESDRVHDSLLNYYNVNQYWFQLSLAHLDLWDRIVAYPVALYEMSPLMSVTFFISLLAWPWVRGRLSAFNYQFSVLSASVLVPRDQPSLSDGSPSRSPTSSSGKCGYCWLLLGVAWAHLLVLVILFARGSAPLFIERVVLFHYGLLLPFPAALLVSVCKTRGDQRSAIGIQPSAAGYQCAPVRGQRSTNSDYAFTADGGTRVLGSRFSVLSSSRATWLVAVVVAIYGGRQLDWAAKVFHNGWFCDHRDVRHAYAELGTWLRLHRDTISGRVVVDSDDRDGVIAVIAGLPRRVRTVQQPEAAPILGQDAVSLLAVPNRELGREWSRGAVEEAFRARNPQSSWQMTELRSWRIYRLRPGHS
jgi:hypothetical protein